MRVKTLLFAGVIAVLSAANAQAKIIYVDDDANGINNGSSWENAYTYLQDALSDAKISTKPVEVRIAQGTYRPDQGQGFTLGDRESSFELVNDVNLVGGYAGVLESEPDVRDIDLYKTILSGDLNRDDVEITNYSLLLYEPSRGDNSYSIITCLDMIDNAVLDGLIITAGNANGTYASAQNGGGMYNYSDNPTLINCTFSKNAASTGGGMYNYDSNPELINCTFVQNVAEDTGGGIYNEADSNSTIINCLFSGNIAGNNGGGIYSKYSKPVITESTFRWNESGANGGAVYNYTSENALLKDCLFGLNLAGNYGGGIFNYSTDCNIADCTFILNMAYSGAGVYNDSYSKPIITRCTFNMNMADNYAGGIYSYRSNMIITDCMFSENHANYGGGIYNYYHSDSNIIDCTFKGNTASRGAGLYNYYYSNSTIDNCAFTENKSSSYGAGIYNYYYSDIIISNCELKKNISDYYGGGMYLNQYCEPNLTNCIFEENSADRGGGLYNNYCNTIINNCVFTKNSSYDGGGIYNYRYSPVINNCIISENYSEEGGGCFNYNSTPVITNCTFSKNTGVFGGGGVYNNSNSEPEFIDCIFDKNESAKGGGMYNYTSNPKFKSCKFTNNSAYQYGGGIYNYGDNKEVKDCIFSANFAEVSGGAFFHYNCKSTISNCILTGNQAAERGAGMEIYRTSDITVVNCTFEGNKSSFGTAISCYTDFESYTSQVEIRNCILWDNNVIYNGNKSLLNIAYCNVKGGQYSSYDPSGKITWGDGIIYMDPAFVSSGYKDSNGTPGNTSDDFWVDGDYHLKSQAGRYDPNSHSWVIDDITSPCIDTGNKATPIGYEPYPNGDTINMGVYGSTFEASMSLYDVNHFQQAFSPYPSDGEANIALDVLPFWSSDSNAAAHELYFGANEYPPFIRRQNVLKFDPGALEPNTIYFWRVDDVDSMFNRVSGKRWTFLTGPHPAYTYNPNPLDGAEDVELSTTISWNPGIDAVEHNVYLGTDINDVINATVENPLNVLVSVEQDQNYYNPSSYDFEQTYYWRVDEVNNSHVITRGDIWMFTTGTQPTKAYNPNPYYLATNVRRDVTLSWSSGLNATVHDVYFGTNFADVNQASLTNPMNVLVSANQSSNSYTPAMILDYARTYYWRIDERGSNGVTTKGDIWTFITESGGKGRGCFTEQTPVFVDNSSITIAAASIGQSVEGNSGIEAIQVHEGTYTLYDVLLESGNTLTVAENHIFMTEDGNWQPLYNLKASMKLKTREGSVEIKSITRQPELFTGKVYNLKIKNSDQYMVGEDLIIVRDF